MNVIQSYHWVRSCQAFLTVNFNLKSSLAKDKIVIHPRCTLSSPLPWAEICTAHARVPASSGFVPAPPLRSVIPYTWAEKSESFERINSIRETNGNFDSCNSCKRLVISRLHEFHESKFPFVSRIEFIRSKLPIFFCSCIRGRWLKVTGCRRARPGPARPVSGAERKYRARVPSYSIVVPLCGVARGGESARRADLVIWWFGGAAGGRSVWQRDDCRETTERPGVSGPSCDGG